MYLGVSQASHPRRAESKRYPNFSGSPVLMSAPFSAERPMVTHLRQLNVTEDGQERRSVTAFKVTHCYRRTAGTLTRLSVL